MSKDDESVEEKVAALPAVPKAFIEGYGVSVGQLPDPTKSYAEGGPLGGRTPEGYRFNLGGATNRVCERCGAVVADTDLHNDFHDRVGPVDD